MMLTVARAHHAAADRPDSHKHADAPAAATASRVVGPASSSERLALACRPRSARVQGTAPLVSQQALSTMRLAYAYVTPTPASARMFIRRAIQAVAPDLRWSSVRLGSARGASAMRFCTPAWLDEAMRGRTFAYAGATRELVRGWGTSVLDDYLVHVALRDYPAEQRTEDIGANFRSFGWVVEIDPSCLAEPDLATVHALLCVGHPREIPHELRIGYADGCTSVVPVDILGVWDWRAAFRAMEGTGASSSSSQDRDRH